MSLTATSSAEKVESYLGECLSRVGVGDKLPSVRQVMRDCGVSQAVVDRVLTRYQAKGLVEVLPRSGFYRAEKCHTPSPVVTILFFGGADHLAPGRYENELFGLMSGQITKHGMAMRVQLMEPESDHVKTVKELTRRKPPFVVTFSINLQHFHLVQYLNRHGIPSLHLFPNLAEVIGPCLMVHDEMLVRQQVEHLVKLGHRRIAYLHDVEKKENCTWARQNRLDIFYRLCLEYNLDVRQDWVRFLRKDANSIRHTVRDIMTQKGVKPSGFIIYDEHVNPTYTALRECGFTPGRDVSVVGTNDMAWAKHIDPPLTSVRLPRARSADIGFEMMDEIVAGRNPGVRYLETEIVVRNSTCPATPETNGSISRRTGVGDK